MDLRQTWVQPIHVLFFFCEMKGTADERDVKLILKGKNTMFWTFLR